MLYQAICLFVYGTCLASFSVCYAQRYRVKLSIFAPRSFCDTCQHPLKFWQLCPILGYFLQKGYCTFCHTKISFQSTLFEILGGIILNILGANLTPIRWPLLFALFFWCLTLSLQDYYTQTVASSLLYLGSCFILLCGMHQVYFIFKTQWSLLIPLILFLGCLSYLNQLGSADVIFILVISCLLGFFYTIWLLFIACLLALSYCLLNRTTKIAFIPFLSLSLLLILLYLKFT